VKIVTLFELAFELDRTGMTAQEIAVRVGRDRSTVFRWLAGIKKVGIREFVRRKKTAKRRRQPRKLNVDIKRQIIKIRRQYDWCGQKIQKELAENYQIKVCLMSIYRVLREEFVVGNKWRKYKKRGEAPTADAPRQVVEHDTVDFGELYAFTSIDIFTKEPFVVMATELTSQAGTACLRAQQQYFGAVELHQSDEGPEFKGRFVETVQDNGSKHRYSRPYKKNDQAYIENFNRSLRKECLGWGKYKKTDLITAQQRVGAWLEHWQTERWHMGLPNMQTPAQFVTEWYGKQNQVAG
jgi:IS30 family transposase